jgi:DNA polymerase III subunit beta
MRFTVPQKEFLTLLQKLSAVVPSKTTHPILNNILFKLDESRLEMVATDLEISLSTSLEVTMYEGGELAIPAKRLLDIVKELDDLPVNLQTDKNGHVEITSGQANFTIPGENADSFPMLPEISIDSELKISGDKIRKHIERLVFAVSSDELRPVLTGVLFEFKEESFNLVATDGHRMVRIKDASLAGKEELGSIVVPVKALNLLSRSIDSADAELTIGMAQTHIVFNIGDINIFSRLIDGRYPAYDGVIPQQNENIMQASRSAVSRCIKQVSHCANNITRQINVSLTEDKLVISAEDNEYGSRARTELDVDYNGDPLEIAFNASYIDQMLKHVNTENVLFKLGSAERAALILPEVNQDNEDFLMLLMPVRLMRS